ncbi:HD domain-containing protein [Ruminiclostridium cellulolyticum]|uniref:Metal dependent phosphohydrolase n=1 Tax=Ruminiclostridium cellulolyticum (strain ATCC 35319 / DSM 5812 / JCM 6584 / H10) TaxID=394503 RepID=B8I185_RUMCH|nr:HD domain-containing protein [Ruminiclostridium cellulolyticum]ACL75683.1 metal dependent phosphohydrolase [Ruminiclostridium cellulolyticum H10]
MKKVHKILSHPQFKKYMELNFQAEQDRKFCRHDIQHSIDVARVAYIISLENNYNLDKEIIYITALLHDIARWKQYSEKVDHAAEGAVLARGILRDLKMDNNDTEMILDAIAKHRKKEGHSTPLSKVLYAGDKSCRQCIVCSMVEECNRYEDGYKPVLYY